VSPARHRWRTPGGSGDRGHHRWPEAPAAAPPAASRQPVAQMPRSWWLAQSPNAAGTILAAQAPAWLRARPWRLGCICSHRLSAGHQPPSGQTKQQPPESRALEWPTSAALQPTAMRPCRSSRQERHVLPGQRAGVIVADWTTLLIR